MQHQSAAVRSGTIGWLTEAKMFLPAYVESRLGDPDLEVRIQAVRHLCEKGRHGRATLKRCLTHSNSSLVLAAVYCIARYRAADGDLIDERWIERATMRRGDDGIDARSAAARALGIVQTPRANEFLDRLLDDSSVEVIRQAAWAAGERRHEGAIFRLTLMLGRAALRREAREALVKLGAQALRELRLRFRDERTPMNVRARIPKVVSRSPDQGAVDFLLENVHRVHPRLDIPLIKALNRMRTQAPELQFDEERVKGLIRAEAETHGRLRAIRHAIQSGRGDDAETAGSELFTLLERAVGERLDEIVDRVLRLLHLIHAPTDIRSVHCSVNAQPARRASAVEFLDNIIDRQLRDVVLPLMEDSHAQRSADPAVALSVDQAVVALLAEDDDWLKSIARALTGEQVPVAAGSY
jgi:AAA family ATP:ADP antiporter